MGDGGSAYKVGTLSIYLDDLHTEGILQVLCEGDYPITWSVNVYSIGSKSQVYSLLLEEFPASHGDTVDDEHCFSSIDERSVREDHPNIKGHAIGMRP